MQKIINGRKYNTETAKEVYHYNSICPRNDVQFYEETLYKKRTGEFFLYGIGNCGSKYAKYLKGYNCYTGGEGIIPLTEKEAKDYMEGYAETEEYERLFGEVEE